MAFVPAEGQADRSQARSAWKVVPRENRPVGYGMIRRSFRPGKAKGVLAYQGPGLYFAFEAPSLQSSNRCAHRQESDRTLRDGSFSGRRFPGTLCQATIMLSLRRDENTFSAPGL
jgi:hypothetical protein